MEHILLTGCAGFIGSHTAEQLLSRGYRITGIDNFDPFYAKTIKEQNLAGLVGEKKFSFAEADIRDKNQLKRLKGDFGLVIHLASKAGVRPSILDPAEYISVNINGTYTLLDWMQSRGIRSMIFGSSSSVYGNHPQKPFQEDADAGRPISPYAATKKAAELLNYTYHELYGMNILNLRFFTVYGPRQRPDLAICKFAKLISENKPVTIFGKGQSARDYTYIDDIVSGIMAAVNYLRSREKTYDIINLGNSYPVALNLLVEKLYTLFGKKPSAEYLPEQPGDVEITFADISKAKKLLGYAPVVSLDEGLKKFISWYNTSGR